MQNKTPETVAATSILLTTYDGNGSNKPDFSFTQYYVKENVILD